MPTFSALAGYPLDPGKIYDGWDMSALLFAQAPGGGSCTGPARAGCAYMTHR